MISIGSIISNLAIAYFTGDALKEYFSDRYDEIQIFLLVIMVEHIIILFKMLLASLIADVPNWVQEGEIEKTQNEEALWKLLEEKADEYEERGHTLLEDLIKKAKKDKKEKSKKKDGTTDFTKMRFNLFDLHGGKPPAKEKKKEINKRISMAALGGQDFLYDRIMNNKK